jgi:hypothetical protein
MNTYTFFVRFNGHEYFEEIDVKAISPAEALRLARVEADDLYGPDVILELTAPGGTGGLVTWISN